VNALEDLKIRTSEDVVVLAADETASIVSAAIEKINAVVRICASASDVAKQPFDNTIDYASQVRVECASLGLQRCGAILCPPNHWEVVSEETE
jgi:hypothetical protein